MVSALIVGSSDRPAVADKRTGAELGIDPVTDSVFSSVVARFTRCRGHAELDPPVGTGGTRIRRGKDYRFGGGRRLLRGVLW